MNHELNKEDRLLTDGIPIIRDVYICFKEIQGTYRTARKDFEFRQRHKPNMISKGGDANGQHRMWFIAKHCK